MGVLLAQLFCVAAVPIPGNSLHLEPLAPGVYAAVRRVTAGSADGNTLIIVNDSDVVVVDSGGYLESARQTIAEIRKLSPFD